MSWALRWLVVGMAIATVLHLVYDPPLGLTLAALWLGYVVGVLVFCVSELFEQWNKE